MRLLVNHIALVDGPQLRLAILSTCMGSAARVVASPNVVSLLGGIPQEVVGSLANPGDIKRGSKGPTLLVSLPSSLPGNVGLETSGQQRSGNNRPSPGRLMRDKVRGLKAVNVVSGFKPAHDSIHHPRHLYGPLLSARGAMEGRQLREMRGGSEEN